jgi:hypothetical protein
MVPADTSPAESEQGSEWLSAFLSSASQRDAFADSLQSDVAEIESMIEQTKTLVVPRKSDERQHKEQLLQSMDDKVFLYCMCGSMVLVCLNVDDVRYRPKRIIFDAKPSAKLLKQKKHVLLPSARCD